MAKCPHCNSDNITVHSINCPDCSNRVRCPECGSLLVYKDEAYKLVECPACDFKMPHGFHQREAELTAAQRGLETPTPSLPVENITDWEKDRWKAANRLLFPEEDDIAIMLYVVKKDDIEYYNAKCPDFGDKDIEELLATLTIRKKEEVI